jgi:hypothetical protein
MTDLILNLIGTIIGCLAAGLIFYFLAKFIFFKFLIEKHVYFVSFITSCLLIIIVYSYLNGFVMGNLKYIVGISFWFIIDLIRLNRREKLSERYDSDSLHIK